MSERCQFYAVYFTLQLSKCGMCLGLMWGSNYNLCINASFRVRSKAWSKQPIECTCKLVISSPDDIVFFGTQVRTLSAILNCGKKTPQGLKDKFALPLSLHMTVISQFSHFMSFMLYSSVTHNELATQWGSVLYEFSLFIIIQ